MSGVVGFSGSAAAGSQRSVLDCYGNPKSPNGATGVCYGVPAGWQYRTWVRCGNTNYKNVGPWVVNRQYSDAWCNWDDERRDRGVEERFIG
ncbi:hypothetical protein [Allokutzneria oryzae]|uniref:Uncharacterized protein n=1 Tax=Allokutzneria oryzae TaxID=1378989 RepID=A0ABV5ZY25_9PSEU